MREDGRRRTTATATLAATAPVQPVAATGLPTMDAAMTPARQPLEHATESRVAPIAAETDRPDAAVRDDVRALSTAAASGSPTDVGSMDRHAVAAEAGRSASAR